MLHAEATIDDVLGNDTSQQVMSLGLLESSDVHLDLCWVGSVKLGHRHINHDKDPPHTHSEESKGHEFGL